MKIKINYLILLLVSILLLSLSLYSQPLTITQVSQVQGEGGYFNDVFIHGDYAIASTWDNGLFIFDITNHAAPRLVSRFNMTDRVNDIAISGNYAYVANSSEGLQVLDISNPLTMRRIANCPLTPPYQRAVSVIVRDNYAFLAVERLGLIIFDISNPSAPRELETFGSDLYPSSIYLQGNYIYMGTYSRYADDPQPSRFHVIDISVPRAPFAVSSTDSIGHISSIYVQNNYAYLTGEYNNINLRIINLANISSPEIVNEINIGEGFNEIVVRGNYAFAIARNSGLSIVNVSNPATASIIKTFDTPGSAAGLEVIGNYCYIADGSEGIKIVNISTPASPSLLGSWKPGNNLTGSSLTLSSTGKYAYLWGSSPHPQILVYDVSYPATPTFISKYLPSADVNDVFIQGNMAYLWLQNKIQIIDISSPSSFVLKGSYPLTGLIDDVTVAGNYLYIASPYWNKGIEIVNISNPNNPVFTGSLKTSNITSPENMWVNGNYLYIAEYNKGLMVLDISTPTAPQLISTLSSVKPGYHIKGSGQYAYVANANSFYAVDISNPLQPVLKGTYSLTGLRNFTIYGNYAFITWSDGVKILDLSIPAHPSPANLTLCGEYQTSEDLYDIEARQSYIYLTSKNFTILKYSQSQTPPALVLSRSQMYFAAQYLDGTTGTQSLYISNSGAGNLSWNITSDSPWLYASPSSGSSSSEVLVSANPAGLTPGVYTGKLTVTDPLATNSPQYVHVTFTILGSGASTPPFGEFATPLDYSTVAGSIPVTGWALDDIKVQDVKIYYEYQGTLIYIDKATFVEGARPDVEQAFPGYPGNHRAGWGYMLLTNFLQGGNGQFTLHAIATDVEGNQTTLGTKTITLDNTHAVKPFGAIDTPTQGGTASGKRFVNFGWVLTPQPNTIPFDGSTIQVWVDGVPLGHPVYNQYRSDIAQFFPGYNNTNGAVGFYYLDTTLYSNGLHTIQWTATDSAGNNDGIGSRFFTILNNQPTAADQTSISNPTPTSKHPIKSSLNPSHPVPDMSMKKLSLIEPDRDLSSIDVRLGFDLNQPFQEMALNQDDIFLIEANELDRLEISFPLYTVGTHLQSYQQIGGKFYSIPVGSTLDAENGKFTWLLGPGFSHEYHLVFIADRQGVLTQSHVIVRVKQKQK